MITYAGFITEIKRLVAEAKRLRSANKMHQDDRFRKWRNELEGVLSQIAQVGFLLPCPVRVKVREFGYTSNERIPDAERLKWYQMEMDDTINELDFIIDSYQKHVEPPVADSKKPSTAGWPEKVTLSWLYHHAPIGLWLKVGAVAIAIFAAGAYVGQNETYRKALDLFRDSPAVKNAP